MSRDADRFVRSRWRPRRAGAIEPPESGVSEIQVAPPKQRISRRVENAMFSTGILSCRKFPDASRRRAQINQWRLINEGHVWLAVLFATFAFWFCFMNIRMPHRRSIGSFSTIFSDRTTVLMIVATRNPNHAAQINLRKSRIQDGRARRRGVSRLSGTCE